MTVLLVSLCILAVALPWGGAHYLARLPYAPECPRCHAVTGPHAHPRLFDRVFARLASATRRTCERCGWAGRMRWRLATERVHRERRHG